MHFHEPVPTVLLVSGIRLWASVSNRGAQHLKTINFPDPVPAEKLVRGALSLAGGLVFAAAAVGPPVALGRQRQAPPAGGTAELVSSAGGSGAVSIGVVAVGLVATVTAVQQGITDLKVMSMSDPFIFL